MTLERLLYFILCLVAIFVIYKLAVLLIAAL